MRAKPAEGILSKDFPFKGCIKGIAGVGIASTDRIFTAKGIVQAAADPFGPRVNADLAESINNRGSFAKQNCIVAV